MACRFTIFLLAFLSFSFSCFCSRSRSRSRSHSHSHSRSLTEDPNSISDSIRQACNATRFPDSCQAVLYKADLPDPPKPMDIILTSIQISYENLQSAKYMIQSMNETAFQTRNQNLSLAATNCLEALRFSEYRHTTSASSEILPRGRTKDARAWMSAALGYQYDCYSGLKYVNVSNIVNDTMTFLLSLSDLTSNALSMVVSYDLYGGDTALWRPPMTERSGFWGNGIGGGEAVSGNRGGFPSKSTADATVCKNGEGGCHPTVQSAVDAAPEKLDGGRRFTIYIKEGVYNEIVRVPLEKKNVVFLGDGMGKTVITGNLKVGMPGVSTSSSATVGVFGDGFMARDLTIENAAGPDAHQAVAFRSNSDLSILYNCEILGHQDTLYPHTLRQFYKSCRIVGTIDFIFGNSASVFQDCVMLVRPRQLEPEKGDTNVVTAHGRTDPAQSTGFVFVNCTINGTDEYMALYHQNPLAHKTYLGRPWKEYSRTVIIQSYLEDLIRPEGWLIWDGDFALSTLFYGELDNTGPGAKLTDRVKWSNQIPAEHVSTYSLENFIQGNQWIPSDSK